MAFVKVDTPDSGAAKFYFQRPFSQPREIKWLRYLLIAGLVSTLLSLAGLIKQSRTIGSQSGRSSAYLYTLWPIEVDYAVQGRAAYCQENRRDCRRNELTPLTGDWGDRTMSFTAEIAVYDEDVHYSNWEVREDALDDYWLGYDISIADRTMYLAGDIAKMLRVTTKFLATGLFLAIFFIIGRYIFLILRINSGFPNVYYKILQLAGIQIAVELVMFVYMGLVDRGVYTIDFHHSIRPSGI